jgi:hypothetical protein
MDWEIAVAWGSFVQGWEAFVEEYGWLPREKLWVYFLAKNQEAAELLEFAVDPAPHWPVTQSGCLTPCAICDAPENDEEFAGFETADGRVPLSVEAAGQSREFPCLWSWTERTEERWELKQAEETGSALRALFDEERIGDLD